MSLKLRYGNPYFANKNKTNLLILIPLLFLFLPVLVFGNYPGAVEEFLNGRFSECKKILEKKTKTGFSPVEKILYLEVLLTDGKYQEAKSIISKSQNEQQNPEWISINLLYDLSRGDLISARKKYTLLYNTSSAKLRVLRIKILYNLFVRNFIEADRIFKTIRTRFPSFAKTTLFFILGNEIYKYCKNIYGLHDLYKGKLKNLKKRAGKKIIRDLKATEKLFRGKKITPFYVESESDLLELPFHSSSKTHVNTLELKLKGKSYSIILDTGNTTGWMIHSRDLRELSKPKRGGRIITRIGTESGDLDGFSIHCKQLKLKNFKIRDLYGIYVPKPRSDFYDANLNPVFIRNRVVTMDFINNKLILRTEKRFEDDLKKERDLRIIRSPWFGYRYPMVPVIISGVNGYAIIESGAEDISVRIETAIKAGLKLFPRIKYLSNGKKFNYSLSSVEIQLGNYLFVRKKTEIWPLDRFRNSLTGFTPDAVLGPEAFGGKFAISFMPKKNVVVFQYEKHKR